MRSARVSTPCSVRKALNGEMQEPRSRSSVDAGLEDIGDRPERLGRFAPYRAVVAGIGRVERRLALLVLLPWKIAAVDDEAADRVAVAAEIFGRRIDDDRRAVLERPGQNWRGGVVHDQRNAERTADRRHLRDREGDQLRIGQRLGVIGAGARVGRFAEILRISRIDEAHLDPLVLHRVGEQVPGAPVKVGRGDDVVARPRQVLDRKGRGRLAAGERQRR